MNNTTIEKLKKNPHYKLSEKQKQFSDERMVQFGKLPLHPTKLKKVAV